MDSSWHRQISPDGESAFSRMSQHQLATRSLASEVSDATVIL